MLRRTMQIPGMVPMVGIWQEEFEPHIMVAVENSDEFEIACGRAPNHRELLNYVGDNVVQYAAREMKTNILM